MVLYTREYDTSKLGRSIDNQEMRKAQLEILDAFVDFCEANDLTYYLSGGTLLGAVRHKGYIPWDDDIDINMPRPDYQKLIQLTQGKLGEHLEIAAVEGPIFHDQPFPRVYDTRYILKSTMQNRKDFYFSNLFIDIFPIEGLPSDMQEVKKHYRKAKSLQIMRKLAYLKNNTQNMPRNWHRLIREISRPFARLMGHRFWNLRLLKLAKKYKYDECAYVGVVTGGMHTLEEYIEREGYGVPMKVEFEGKMYNAPADTHKYLSNLYGNYMQLPPEEKRKSHHLFEIYKSKEA